MIDRAGELATLAQLEATRAQVEPSSHPTTRLGAVLLDFHNTLAVPRSIDDWLSDARGLLVSGQRLPSPESIRDVWRNAKRLFPNRDWDLDPSLHRSTFIQTLSCCGETSTEVAGALYDVMPQQWVLNEGALSFIHRATRAGVRLAVLSNIAIDIRPALEGWGIASSFHAVILSYEVGCVKPDARIFKLAVDALEVPATDCLMIGDSEHDDTGGTVLGMQSLISKPEEMRRAFGLVGAVMASGVGP